MDKMRFASVDDDEPDSEWDAPLTPPTRPTGLRSPAPRQSTAYAPEPTFGATAEHGAPPRRWAALAAVAVIMAAAAGTVYVVYSPSAAGMIASGRAAVSPEAAPGSHPIELLSLRHSTDPDGAFTVTGLVQNPIDGRLARHIVAVVYLFDREGNYFASGKATLDFTALQPGEESPFVVRIPGAGPVSRYRVGFRSEEGGVVAHIDRRGQLPGGTTGDAIEARPTVTPSVATRRSEG